MKQWSILFLPHGISIILLNYGANKSRAFRSVPCSSSHPKRPILVCGVHDTLTRYLVYKPMWYFLARKLGTSIWPCKSFIVFCYLHTKFLKKSVKTHHPSFTLVQSSLVYCTVICNCWASSPAAFMCCILVNGHFACIYVCVPHVCSVQGGLSRALDSLEMELQLVVSCV